MMPCVPQLKNLSAKWIVQVASQNATSKPAGSNTLWKALAAAITLAVSSLLHGWRLKKIVKKEGAIQSLFQAMMKITQFTEWLAVKPSRFVGFLKKNENLSVSSTQCDYINLFRHGLAFRIMINLTIRYNGSPQNPIIKAADRTKIGLGRPRKNSHPK